MAEFPEPLTTEGIDLSHVAGFMIDVQRFLASELRVTTGGDEFKAAITLQCWAWRGKPIASLPDNDRMLARLSGTSLRKWRRMRERALIGFIRCSDGRLYHKGLAEQAIRLTSKLWQTPEWTELRRLVFERDGYACQYCGTTDQPLECDHITPRALGGTNAIDNLTTACKSCNSSKSDTPLDEWLERRPTQ